MRLQKSTLRRLLEKKELTEQKVKRILYQCLCSLKFLHVANIMHRDIKPGNILINEKGPVLCDFGLSRTLPECCQSKHQGHSGKLRSSVLSKLEPGFSKEQEQKAIAVKLTKILVK